MKLSEGTKLVAVIQAAYPRQPWPDPTVSLYADELARLPLEPERAHALVRQMIRERQSEWAPTIGEIVQHLIASLDAAPPFDAAWAEMISKASAGSYFRPDEPPAFSHPAIETFARFLGWRAFCLASPLDGFYRRQAAKLYAEVCEQRTKIALRSPEMVRALGPGDVSPEVRALAEGIGGGA